MPSDVTFLVDLADRFGLCLPANSRHLVAVDAMIGDDGEKDFSERWGTMHTLNWCVCWPDIGCGNEIILHTGHQKVRAHYAV